MQAFTSAGGRKPFFALGVLIPVLIRRRLPLAQNSIAQTPLGF